MRIIFILLFTIHYSLLIYSRDPHKGCQLPADIPSGEYKLLKSCSPYIAPKSVTVGVSATLTSEPGVEIQLPDSAIITINGSINLVGTEQEPIHFRKTDNAKRWFYIYVYKSKDSAVFDHVIFDDALRAVWTHNTKLGMRNITANNVINFVKVKYGSAKITNCRVYSTEETGSEIADIIQGIQARMTVINNFIRCPVKGAKTDGIDVNGASDIIISGNTIIGSEFIRNADCIDADNCPNITIKNNIIHNIKDKGLSLGNSTSGKVTGNIIYNSSIGIAVKDTASIEIINNTLYSNDTSLYLRNKATATVVNTIISGSDKTDLYNSSSTFTISYSLCDKQLFAGTGNIKDNPLFVNASMQDFNLKYNSPCIDKGDPVSPNDPDGTRADIGALPYNHSAIKNIYINEFLAVNKSINKDEANEYDGWLELYNANSFELNTAGLYLTDDKSNPLKFKIPSGTDQTKIPARGYKLVWCDNKASQGALHANFTMGADKVWLGLYQQNNAQTLLLDSISSGGQHSDVSYIRYPDGNKYASYTLMPTPGASNILIIDDINNQLTNNEEQTLNVFPNPAKDKIFIKLRNTVPCSAVVSLSDITGKTIILKDFDLSFSGEHNFIIPEGTEKLNGIYFLRISTGENIFNRKVIFVNEN